MMGSRHHRDLTYVRMLDVPDWFLSAVRASEWNYLGITRLGFRAIIVVFDDALRDQEAIEIFRVAATSQCLSSCHH
jgi:hypothetical protein